MVLKTPTWEGKMEHSTPLKPPNNCHPAYLTYMQSTKQKQVSGRHGTLSIISLYTGLGKYFPKCVLWDTMVCQTLIFIPLNREKGFVMKFLGRLSGSNRFICCYVFKPLIPNVDYKYLKEGCRLCFFSRALGHFFIELLL